MSIHGEPTSGAWIACLTADFKPASVSAGRRDSTQEEFNVKCFLRSAALQGDDSDAVVMAGPGLRVDLQHDLAELTLVLEEVDRVPGSTQGEDLIDNRSELAPRE